MKTLFSYKTAYKSSLVFFSVVSLSLVAGIVGLAIFFTIEIKEIRQLVYVMNQSGAVFSANAQPAEAGRIVEYQNHVKTFYNLWYAFDEGSYEGNINAGLFLIGESGKQLKASYDASGILSSLKQMNMVVTTHIEDIKIDVNTVPHTGYILGTQTIKRLRGEATRRLDCTFILYDVARTPENPHGVKLENWEVYNNAVVQ